MDPFAEGDFAQPILAPFVTSGSEQSWVVICATK
jgi:hypothetical protein